LIWRKKKVRERNYGRYRRKNCGNVQRLDEPKVHSERRSSFSTKMGPATLKPFPDWLRVTGSNRCDASIAAVF
jgi:hypothetical protein